MTAQPPLHRLSLVAAAELARVGQAVTTRALRWAGRQLDPDAAVALTARFYGRAARYVQPWHQDLGLFDFERESVESAFPAPPAALLILGLGGGREARALVGRGYRVAGCEPIDALAEAARRSLPAGTEVATCTAEALWAAPGCLRGPFDGAIFGWGAYSHVFTQADRRAALRAIRARLSDGAPLLLSWPLVPARGLRSGGTTSGEVRSGGAPKVGAAHTGTQHGWRVVPGGLVHLVYGAADLEGDAAATGWEVEAFYGAERGYPHALLRAMAA